MSKRQGSDRPISQNKKRQQTSHILASTIGPVLEKLEQRQLLSLTAGSLDTSFNTTGLQVTDFNSSNDVGKSVTVASNGDIVVGGSSNGDFALSLYSPAGTLLSKVITQIGTSTQAQANAVTFDSSGRILAAGQVANGSTLEDIAVARYTITGNTLALDTSFGTSGYVVTDVNSSRNPASASANDYGNAVAFDGTNSDIIVAGQTGSGASEHAVILAYNSSGALDSSFGAGGSGILVSTGSRDFANAVTVTSTGAIVAAGGQAFGHSELIVAAANGSSDNIYSLNLGSSDSANAVYALPSGEYLVAGTADSSSVLAEVTAGGALDPSFGVGGKVETSFGSSFAEANGLAVQTNGKIIVAGTELDASGNQFFAVARYSATGVPDTNFGSSGTVTTDFSGNKSADSVAGGVAIQSDGQIVVAGYTGAGAVPNDFAIARYVSNNAPTAANNTATLTGIDQGETTSAGNTVASLASQLGLSDVDGDPVGIAVTGGVSSPDGNWQYSLNSGTNWSNFTGVSASNALLLTTAPSNLVRFVPTGTFNGTATLSLQAWDQTKGTNGGTLNIAANAAANYNSFSDATYSANINVGPLANTVYVNSTWSTASQGQTVTDSLGDTHTFGIDAFATIQNGVTFVNSGGTVNVDGGASGSPLTYTELVNVAQPLTLSAYGQATPTVTAPNAASNAAVISVNAADVTVEGFNVIVDQPHAGAGIAAASGATGPNVFTGLQVLNNVITSTGSSGAFSTAFGASTIGIAALANGGGTAPDITISGNSIIPEGSDTTVLKRAIWVNEAEGTIGGTGAGQGNTTAATTEDALIAFSRGTTNVEGNTFDGAGVTITEPNASAPTNITGNQFTPQGLGVDDAALEIKHNYNSTSPVLIQGNNFTVPSNTIGILSGASIGVSVNDNTFSTRLTANTGNAVDIDVDTMIPSSSQPAASTLFPNSIGITGNTFNSTSGDNTTAIQIANHDAGAITPDFGSITIGGAGSAANTFSDNLVNFIVEAPETTSVSFSSDPYSGSQVHEGNVPVNIDASQNNFGVTSGHTLGSYTLPDYYEIEDKIVDGVDYAGGGLVSIEAGNVFVTPNSFVPSLASDDTGAIQRAVNVASAGDTVNVEAGVYIGGSFDDTMDGVVAALYINKAISVIGPNAAFDPNSNPATSNTQAVLEPGFSNPSPTSSTESVGIDVVSSSVTIEGLTVDGSNTGLTHSGGVVFNGVPIDEAEGIVSYRGVGDITVQGNIVENTDYSGVDFFNNDNPAATSDNTIADNLIQHLSDNLGFGVGVLLSNNFYAQVIDNLITDVYVGVQTGNFFNANNGPSFAPEISNNTIQTRHDGIFYNLHYSAATGFSIDNNTITAIAQPAGDTIPPHWTGIAITSQQSGVSVSLSDNNIDGTGASFSTASSGYVLWNDPTTGSISITGGTVTGVSYGVWANSYEGDAGPGGAVSATVSGVNITANTAGVYVEDSYPTFTAQFQAAPAPEAPVSLTITGDTSITTGGSGTGILVSGPDASATVTGNDASIFGNAIGIEVTGGSATISSNHIYDNTTGIEFTGGGSGSVTGNNFAGTTDNGTDLLIDSTAGTVTDGGSNAFAATSDDVVNYSTQGVNATGDTFNGIDPTTLSPATPADLTTLYGIEDQIIDGIDLAGAGLVRIKPNDVFVTINSFDSAAVPAPLVSTTDADIQRGVDAATSGDSLFIQNGSYYNNITVDKTLTITGAGQGATVIYPAVSDPLGDGSESSLNGGSNVILVQANNVIIQQLTVDGNNPNLTSGQTSNGVDVDARNGIIEDESDGAFNGLNVNHVTIQNIYLRGLYASSGGTFDFENNIVTNVAGDPTEAIAIFNYGGSGIFENNTVSYAEDAISSNWSTGVQFLDNTITNSGSGIHTDNSGEFGSTDEIADNHISLGTAGSYGIFVFGPYGGVSVHDNTISGVQVGLAEFGSQGPTAPNISFLRNSVDLTGVADSTGAYVTTSLLGFGYAEASATFTSNSIENADTGVDIEHDAGDATTDNPSVVLNSNDITSDSGDGVFVSGGNVMAENNTISGDGEGVVVSNGASVDLGDTAGGHTVNTGVAASAGNNDLSGYTGVGGNYAIDDQNTVAGSQPDVIAYNNNFGAVSQNNPAFIGQVVHDSADDPTLTTVFYIPAQEQPAPSVVYVNASWAGTALGADADGAGGGAMGNGTAFGYDEFADIQDAVNAVKSGGIVDVYNGSYQSNVVIANPVTINGQSSSVDVTPVTGGGNSQTAFLIESGNVTIDNLTIDGQTNTMSSDQFANGVITQYASAGGNFLGIAPYVYNDLTAQDLTVQNVSSRGIDFKNQGSGYEIVGNTLTNAGSQAITVIGGTALIQGNTITDNTQQDIGIAANSLYDVSNNAFSADLTIQGNTITGENAGMYLSGLAAGSLIGGTGAGDANTVDSSAGGTGAAAILITFSHGTTTVQGNQLSAGGDGDGILLFDDSEGAVQILGNQIEAASSASDSNGIAAGIYMTDNPASVGESSSTGTSATILGNTISGFVTGIDVESINNGADQVAAAIGDAGAGDSNSITGATTGILVSGDGASATINGNNGSIDGNAIGIDISGGTADITGNHIYNNTTGIQIDNGGTANIDSNNFEGGANPENETDINLVGGSAPIIGGTLTGNTFALGSSNAAYYINNTSSENLTALASSNTYNLDGSVQTNNFRIEDAVNHAVDNEAYGLVTWVTNNIFVTAPGSQTANGADTDSSIQRGIDVATAGNTVNVEAGTYTGDLNINKSITLDGAGNPTVAAATAGSDVITISAPNVTVENLSVSGGAAGIFFNSAVDSTSLDNLSLTGASGEEIEVHNNAVLTNLSLNGVTASTNNLTGGVGFRVATMGIVDGMQITASHFDDNAYGLYTNANSGATNNQTGFTNINISGGTTFNNDTFKGIYAEKLDNAVLNGITVNNSGTGASSPDGLNLNLKYGQYTNITIENSSLDSDGTGSPTGAALDIDGRNDAPSYNTNPASISGVTLNNLTFTGSSPIEMSIGDNVTGISMSGDQLNGAGLGLSYFDTAAGLNLGNTSFAGSLAGYIINSSPFAMDATQGATFNGFDTGTGSVPADLTSYYATDAKIIDGVYKTGLGLVRLLADNVFVTPTSFSALVGTSMPSIQRGITAATAGDTVNVEAGTYTGDLIVDRSLTLSGAEANIDPGATGRNPAPESIIMGDASNGAPIEIESGVNNVTVNGFTIQSPSGGSGALGSGIWVNGSTGVAIEYNIIQNNTTGIAIADAGGSINNNLIENNNAPGSGSGNGIEYFSASSGTWTISNNHFTGNTNADVLAAGGPTVSNLTIENNEMTNSGGIDLFNTDNTLIFENSLSDIPVAAVYLGGGDSNIEISQNDISNNPGAAGVQLDDPFSVGANGPGISVHNNFLQNNAYGVLVSAVGLSGSMTVNDNSISGNTTAGLENDSATVVNADNNWWGDASGPTNVSQNPTGTGDKLIDPSVTFSPWLTSGTDADATRADGFQPEAGAEVAISGPSTVFEGNAYTLNLGNSSDVTGWTINWGDSSGPQTIVGDPASTTHVYPLVGHYTITATASTTDDGPVDSNSVAVAVQDAPLTDTTPPTALNSVEGSSTGNVVLATFTDGDPVETGSDLSATVNWGGATSGTPTSSVQFVSTNGINSSTWEVVGQATYVEAGSYQVSVTVNDADGTPSIHSTGQTSVSVADAALSGLSLNPLTPTVSVPLTNVVVATFHDNAGADSNPADLSATIVWGDGHTDTGLAVQESDSSGDYNVVGSHTYLNTGTNLPFSVTVKDVDGSSISQNQNINVAYEVPTIALTGSASTPEGSVYMLNIGALSWNDPITNYDINWGDGTDSGLLSGNPQNTVVPHTFEDGPANETIRISLIDSTAHNINNAGSLAVGVTNVAPTGTLNNFGPVNQGDSVTVFFTNQFDPSPADAASLHYAFDFDNNGTWDTGDGTGTYAGSGTASSVSVPASYLLTAGPHIVAGRIIDKDGGFTDYTTTIVVDNVAPTVNLPASATAGAGSLFTAGGSFTDPGNDTWTAYVDYNYTGGSMTPDLTSDANAQLLTLTGHNFTLSHTYASPGTDNIAVEVIDSNGGIGYGFLPVTVNPTTFQVTGFSPTASGFDVTFNRAPDLGVLNLYSGPGGIYGAPDVTLVGQNTGTVEGSLVWDPTTNTAHFIKTGGVLSPDTYTVTLLSNSGAWQDTSNSLLDGNFDNVAGGDYTNSFVMGSPNAVVSLPDFARAPGQAVDTNYNLTTGIPVSITDSTDTNIKAVDFDLLYNPALLNISGVTLASGLPGGWGVTFNNATPGDLQVTVSGPTALTSGTDTLIDIAAGVPSGATYGASGMLKISSLRVNEGNITSVGDEAVEKAALLGDAAGLGFYDPASSNFISNVVVHNYSGFNAYPLTDPLIIGDATGDGTLSGLDASLVAQTAIGLSHVLPAVPAGLTGVQHGTIDPTISVGNVLANPGTSISVPISLDDASGVYSGLFGISGWDSRLTLTGFTAGTLDSTANGFAFFPNPANGEFDFYSTSNPLPSGSGTIANAQFTVAANATNGTDPVNIVPPDDLDGGTLALTLDDGSVNIETPTVGNEYLFYNNSKYDGNNAAGNSSDYNAIATDKAALLPGGTASFANYSSYSRGLNGILVDFANLAPGTTLSASDFQFNVGNNNTPSGWATAPAPISFTTFTGPNGDTFADIIFADNAIQNEWLQVTALANADTRLASNDVFYFGNAIGSTGDSPTSAQVTSADVTATQSAIGPGLVGITNDYDFNRDGRVTAADKTIVQNAAAGSNVLQLIAPPNNPAVVVPAIFQSIVTLPSSGQSLTTATATNSVLAATSNLSTTTPAAATPVTTKSSKKTVVQPNLWASANISAPVAPANGNGSDSTLFSKVKVGPSWWKNGRSLLD